MDRQEKREQSQALFDRFFQRVTGSFEAHLPQVQVFILGRDRTLSELRIIRQNFSEVFGLGVRLEVILSKGVYFMSVTGASKLVATVGQGYPLVAAWDLDPSGKPDKEVKFKKENLVLPWTDDDLNQGFDRAFAEVTGTDHLVLAGTTVEGDVSAANYDEPLEIDPDDVVIEEVEDSSDSSHQ